MTTRVSGIVKPRAQTRLPLLAQTLAALLFGLVILFAVGFAPIGAVHNAAHDSRHGLTFPCH